MLKAGPCLRRERQGQAKAGLAGRTELSVDNSVLAKVDITAFGSHTFDSGSIAISANEVCGIDSFESRAPGVWGNADTLLRESRHLTAPLAESVAADVLQADVERVVLLEFFEYGEIGPGFAVGAERFLTTVSDQIISQTSPVGDGFVKRFLDPEERNVGDAFEESDHGVNGEAIVTVDQDINVREGLVDGVDDVDVTLEASFGGHPFVTASDFDFELAVTVVVIPAAVFENFVDARGIVRRVEVVEVNHAGVDFGQMRLLSPGHCPDRLIEDDSSEIMERNVDGMIRFRADASGWVDQLGDGLALNELKKLFGRAGLPLSLPPTSRALFGMKDADSQSGGAVAVNASAGITADLTRPRDADSPEFDPLYVMPGERRVGGVREPRQRCGCSSGGSATQKCAAVHSALGHGRLTVRWLT